jgi:hypothetical protein
VPLLQLVLVLQFMFCSRLPAVAAAVSAQIWSTSRSIILKLVL